MYAGASSELGSLVDKPELLARLTKLVDYEVQLQERIEEELNGYV